MSNLLKSKKKKVNKKRTFNWGVPCLKNAQIKWNFSNTPFLRCINRISPRFYNIRNLMKKQAFSAHPTAHCPPLTISAQLCQHLCRLFITLHPSRTLSKSVHLCKRFKCFTVISTSMGHLARCLCIPFTDTANAYVY